MRGRGRPTTARERARWRARAHALPREPRATATRARRPPPTSCVAPWCGHCKNLAPTWEALAAKLAEDGGAIGVGAVDATVHKDLGQRHSVRGYPTLILFKDGEMTTYKGPRELADFEKFLAGGYASLPAKPKPTPPSAASKAKAQLVALFEAIVALFETQFAAALVMTAVAFFTGITVGFAAGLILAPTPKPPKAKPAEKTE